MSLPDADDVIYGSTRDGVRAGMPEEMVESRAAQRETGLLAMWLCLAVPSWVSWLSAWASAIRSLEGSGDQQHPTGTSLCSKCLHLNSKVHPSGPTPSRIWSRSGDEGRTLGQAVTESWPPPPAQLLL